MLVYGVGEGCAQGEQGRHWVLSVGCMDLLSLLEGLDFW